MSSIHTSGRGARAGPTGTIGAPVEQLDLATVIKVSQAVSGEIVLEKLIDTLMRTAIEQAGAERGVAYSTRQETSCGSRRKPTTSGDAVDVHLRRRGRDRGVAAGVGAPLRPAHPGKRHSRRRSVGESIFWRIRTSASSQARSVLCLPLLNQAKLIGVLYLENNLASRVFAPARIAVLKLLASQAAISLENTRLYRDLAEREAKIRRLVDANIIGIFIWNIDGRVLEANDAFLLMVGYEREDLAAGRMRWAGLTPPEWRERDARDLAKS